jgi:hypothetical protein
MGRLLEGGLTLRGAAYAYVILMMVLFHAEQPVEFIYFQF